MRDCKCPECGAQVFMVEGSLLIKGLSREVLEESEEEIKCLKCSHVDKVRAFLPGDGEE